MQSSIRVMTLFIVGMLGGCGGSSVGSAVAPSAASPSPKPSTSPVPGNGINGLYRGDLTFTQENTSYGWPAHLTVTANLRQNSADVTGDFDLLEVRHSGGSVKGTVKAATGDETFGTLIVRFEPNDLGDPFSVDAKITSSDGGRFEGTFVFADGVVGRGNAKFTRCPGSPISLRCL